MICVLVFLTSLDREPLQLDHRVAIAVYWMAFSAEYGTIANLFGVGKSTVHKYSHDVCTAMAVNILDKYVKFPADDDLQHVIDGFDNTWGFLTVQEQWNTNPNNCSRVNSWRLCE